MRIIFGGCFYGWICLKEGCRATEDDDDDADDDDGEE